MSDSKTVKFTEEGSQRLDAALRGASGMSVREAKDVFESGTVLVNGRLVRKAAYIVKPGDLIEATWKPRELLPKADSDRGEQKSRRNFDVRSHIVLDDPDFLVLNKPSGILSVPSQGSSEENAELLVSRFLSLGGKKRRAYAVHRLDRDASGVLVFAKNLPARDALMQAFKDKRVRKFYLAAVPGEGLTVGDQRSIRVPIDEGSGYGPVRTGSGKPAQSEAEVIAIREGTALIRVETKTGRRHQVRAHLASTFAPLLGDKLYQTKQPEHRLGLHAERIEFSHPKHRGKNVVAVAPLPDDFPFPSL